MRGSLSRSLLCGCSVSGEKSRHFLARKSSDSTDLFHALLVTGGTILIIRPACLLNDLLDRAVWLSLVLDVEPLLFGFRFISTSDFGYVTNFDGIYAKVPNAAND